MNERKTKELIQSSVLKTSDRFTEELIERIELKKRQAKALHRAIIAAFVFCGVLLIVIARVPSDFTLPRFQIKLPSLMIKVTGAMFVFIILNKLLSLRAEPL